MIPETITYSEAAERYRINPRTIRRAIDAGLVSAYQPGLTVLIDRKEADAWFLSTKLKSERAMGKPRRGARRI